MSSTNRGKPRNISDYYVTPQKAIKDFLDAFSEDVNWQQDISGIILDPCAGGDKWNDMSYPIVLKKYGIQEYILTIDYRQDSKAEYKMNYLDFKLPFDGTRIGEIEMIISNPPFCDALKFIQHSLTISNIYVIFLLRLNFFGSQERAEWFKNHMPILTYVHSKRMKFTNTTGTDSIEYMHCVWKVNDYPKFTKLRII